MTALSAQRREKEVGNEDHTSKQQTNMQLFNVLTKEPRWFPLSVLLTELPGRLPGQWPQDADFSARVIRDQFCRKPSQERWHSCNQPGQCFPFPATARGDPGGSAQPPLPRGAWPPFSLAKQHY